MDAGTIFYAMLVGHALCDYPLQGDFLARGKNHRAPIPGVPYQWCLFAHAGIHAGAVAFLTSWWLGTFEFVAHAFIDFDKCDGRFGEGERAFSIDQFLHIGCKFIWVLLWIFFK